MTLSNLEYRHEPPSVEDYCNLRVQAGMSPRGKEAARIGLPNSLFAVTVYEGERLIGMARVVGDGGVNFLIVDVAVHPDYQGKGIGKKMMGDIMQYIDSKALPGSLIQLSADPPADNLYKQFGFEYMTDSIGMYKYIYEK
ncbi:GNAT family N-acetyltransferase [Risungbinella massiliensis]|uniref:GNAT family N-acetyltransferase n=1 Tax=Risungbinella massiliensis TaxID=1329796 RepID=UPI0005CBE25A|nr:GNAT family N-acetyltransferase [Risungbinella massiliensis]